MQNSDSKLIDFLASGKKLAEGEINMGVPVRVTCCISSMEAPLDFISSVRAILFQDDSVLVVQDKTPNPTILPGGQCEKGESALDTLRRELLEETGWTAKDTRALGFMHFHHLGPKPDGYRYMYPDFLWPIYIAEAGSHKPEAMQHDEHVVASEFHPIAETMTLNLAPGQLDLLKAAVNLRRNANL